MARSKEFEENVVLEKAMKLQQIIFFAVSSMIVLELCLHSILRLPS